jgi:hypothetical protein
MRCTCRKARPFPRIYAGRLIRKYPVVLRMLERGELHLAGIRLVGPQLTPDNHLELLAAVRCKSKRDIERFIAALCPREDVKNAIRKLPERPAAEPQPEALKLNLEPACGRAPSSPSHLLVARGVQQPDSERVEVGAPGAARIGTGATSAAVGSAERSAPWSEPAVATGDPTDPYPLPVLVSRRADGCNQQIQDSADVNAAPTGSHASTRHVHAGSAAELADPLGRQPPPLAAGADLAGCVTDCPHAPAPSRTPSGMSKVACHARPYELFALRAPSRTRVPRGPRGEPSIRCRMKKMRFQTSRWVQLAKRLNTLVQGQKRDVNPVARAPCGLPTRM